MAKKAGPFIILAITLVIAVVWKQDFVRFLLGFEILALIVCAAEAYYLSKHITGRIRISENIITMNRPFEIGVRVENGTRLPLPEIFLRIAIEDTISGEALLAKSKALLAGSEQGTVSFTLDAAHTGALDVRLERLTVKDHLGIFERRCNVPSDVRSITILPGRPQIEQPVPDTAAKLSDDEGGEFRKGQSAVDPSELRKYQRGDSLRNVHWKVSARTLDLMVKETGDPLEHKTLLYLNLRLPQDDNSKKNRKKVASEATFDRTKRDIFMQLVSDVSSAMQENGRGHRVVWADQKNSCIRTFMITDEQSLKDMLCALVRTDPWEGSGAAGLLKEIRAKYAQEEIIEIDLQGHIIRSRES